MDAIVNLLKPPGISSNTAVNIVKYIFNAKKAGHTGTLDPAAAGVLPVCLNNATKLSEKLMNSKKTYIAEITFGIATDTLDSLGEVTDIKEDASVSHERLLSVIPKFLGEITQITPKYSAAKQNGVPLYKLARQGREIEEKLRCVKIDSIELLNQPGKNKFILQIECGKGTYIRTLCQDIGQELDLPAYMSFLIRTQTSGFHIEDSYTFSELRALKEHTIDNEQLTIISMHGRGPRKAQLFGDEEEQGSERNF